MRCVNEAVDLAPALYSYAIMRDCSHGSSSLLPVQSVVLVESFYLLLLFLHLLQHSIARIQSQRAKLNAIFDLHQNST